MGEGCFERPVEKKEDLEEDLEVLSRAIWEDVVEREEGVEEEDEEVEAEAEERAWRRDRLG